MLTNIYPQKTFLHASAKQKDPLKDQLPEKTTGLIRLIAAAVVSQKFRTLLLRDPAQALEVGHRGETFHLTPSEYEYVLSIQAASLSEFARQLNAKTRANHESNGCYGQVQKRPLACENPY